MFYSVVQNLQSTDQLPEAVDSYSSVAVEPSSSMYEPVPPDTIKAVGKKLRSTPPTQRSSSASEVDSFTSLYSQRSNSVVFRDTMKCERYDLFASVLNQAPSYYH